MTYKGKYVLGISLGVLKLMRVVNLESFNYNFGSCLHTEDECWECWSPLESFISDILKYQNILGFFFQYQELNQSFGYAFLDPYYYWGTGLQS